MEHQYDVLKIGGNGIFSRNSLPVDSSRNENKWRTSLTYRTHILRFHVLRLPPVPLEDKDLDKQKKSTVKPLLGPWTSGCHLSRPFPCLWQDNSVTWFRVTVGDFLTLSTTSIVYTNPASVRAPSDSRRAVWTGNIRPGTQTLVRLYLSIKDIGIYVVKLFVLA